VPLKGEHEEMFLDALETTADLRSWLAHGGDRTLQSYGVDHPRAVPRQDASFLNGCRRHHETETHLFAHAGYKPGLPLADQPPAVLLGSAPTAGWPGPHASGKVAVVGHTPQERGVVLDLGHLICIDTDCQGGGWLTALDVEARHYWQANQQGKVREGWLRAPTIDAAAPRE
jgi:serine/threonine protein phosphatase 1